MNGIWWRVVAISAIFYLVSISEIKAVSTGVMVPLYTYPGVTWTQMITAKKANPGVPMVAIVNPADGPGSSVDQNYVSGISNLKAAGIKVIGYVYTGYGSRDPKADVDKWANWYTIDGIFFDEMSNTVGKETWYRNLSSYAKSKGLNFTVGNPGTVTIESYVGTMDNITIYESPGIPAVSRFMGWYTNYDKSNWSILPFGVTNLDTNFVKEVANYVGFIYVTNDVLDNPWDSLPPYFDSLVGALNGAVSGVKLGDTNSDNMVDLADFANWKREYLGQAVTKKADFNKDAKVDLVDFGIWKTEYLAN